MGCCSSSIPSSRRKPHVVCVPLPCQGDITPMLNFARLLHRRGFCITFVHSEFNYRRLLRSNGSNALDGIPDFRFRTIPDGLPPNSDHQDSTQDIASLCVSTQSTCFGPFCELLRELERDDDPPVTCIVADASMSFAVDAADEFGLPNVVFWAASACAYLAYFHIPELVRRGLTPATATDPSCLRDEEYLNEVREWLPGPPNLIRFRDLPTFVRTTDPNDPMIAYLLKEMERCRRSAGAIVINTFNSLETKVLEILTNSMELPPLYTIGPLNLLVGGTKSDELKYSLWKEESECLKWLDARDPESVVYVNFGSITVVTKEQLLEFAWGLAATNKAFLWVIRPDLVAGRGSAADILPAEFMEETKHRGMLVRWCPQEEVLNHPAVGAFLSHMGWNSTLESICGGVPLLCWPFFADQQTNCRFACEEWGIGKEIIEGHDHVNRGEVERLVIELMDGKEMMPMKAKELKKMAEAAVADGGSSRRNLEQVIHKYILKE